MSRFDPTRAGTLIAVAALCAVAVGTATRPPVEAAELGQSVVRLTAVPQGAGALDTGARPNETRTKALRQSASLDDARRFSAIFAEVAEAVTPAVVRIQTERSLEDLHRGVRGRFEDLFDRLPEDHPVPEFPQVAGGSGVLVSSDGLILTNNHVVSGADRITITLWDKRVFDATVVGTDPTTDMALILIDVGGLPAAQLGNSDGLRVGEWVLAIGNPGFRNSSTLDFTVTSGIVSAKGRPLDVIQNDLYTGGDPVAARYAIEDFIQTDAAINPGNSGGPLIDLDGRVVGINTAIASVNGVNQGYGFAVPINVAKRVMSDLLEHGYVRRPLLGISIQNISPEDAQVYGLTRIAGVLVEDFADDSPAERAGIRRHDVITGIEGTAVERLGQFQRLVARHEPGDLVEVDVVRYGEPLTFSVRLTEANLGRSRVVRTRPEPRPDPGLGLELIELTPTLARERQFNRAGGPLITGVAPASPADRKGVPDNVVIREINRTPVESARRAEQVLRSLPSGSIASLLLEDSQGITLIRNVRVP
jgi:serine protease Do